MRFMVIARSKMHPLRWHTSRSCNRAQVDARHHTKIKGRVTAVAAVRMRAAARTGWKRTPLNRLSPTITVNMIPITERVSMRMKVAMQTRARAQLGVRVVRAVRVRVVSVRGVGVRAVKVVRAMHLRYRQLKASRKERPKLSRQPLSDWMLSSAQVLKQAQ